MGRTRSAFGGSSLNFLQELAGIVANDISAARDLLELDHRQRSLQFADKVIVSDRINDAFASSSGEGAGLLLVGRSGTIYDVVDVSQLYLGPIAGFDLNTAPASKHLGRGRQPELSTAGDLCGQRNGS